MKMELLFWNEDIEATNPCGEQPLDPETRALRLNPRSPLRQDGDFEWDRLRERSRLECGFLDNVVDVTHYPLPFISHAT